MSSASLQQGALAVGGADAGVLRPSFDVLDDVVRLGETTGLLAVQLPHADVAFAVAGHVERRARAVERLVVRAAHANVESVFRDVAVRLGIEGVPHDPAEAAREIVERASSRRAVVVVPVLGACAWDESVCQAIAESTSDALFVLLVPHQVQLLAAGASWFEVGSLLDDAGLLRWWDAVSRVQRLERDSDLVGLEQWVHAAGAAESPGRGTVTLSAAAGELLMHLRLARRAWPVSALGTLGDESLLSTLEAADLVEVRDGFAVARPTELESGRATGQACRRIAAALGQVFPEDPWGFARAAELLAGAGDEPAAERAMQQSFRLSADASSRTGLWRRWADLVEQLPDAERIPARIRGAELALSLGDVDVALEWAERASAGERTGRAAFVLGRASLARGDLVSAEAALVRARDLASGAPARFEALIELGEVAYAAGNLERAEQLAQDVVDRVDLPHARLGARNLLGKLLLARSEWDGADAHFAADACEAAFAGEYVCELRARVNRAIALLSRGSPDEARPMLTEVLEDAERHGEMRAVGFAISNLAVLAIDRHEYGHALELSERAIMVRRRLGDRLGFARDVINLVELRLRLGLIDQAEQALRFGRQALGPGAPASRFAEVALAQARAHLARGRTLDAEREVRAALRTAAQASDGDKLAECHRLAARVALEEGVVARAEAEVERAGQLAASLYAKGEVAVLRALVARAAGRPAADLAETAVLAARETGDEELAREAHMLAAETLLTEGDEETAASHIASAVALREEVCGTLGRELRETYLLRRDLVRLARLERVTAQERHEADEVPRSSGSARPRSKRGSGPRFVGRHPAVRALLASVQRVGRTGATVLVHGESGTGKELIAEGIHGASERASGPLVKVNCAALVESLLLSELFGHEKGAFTGAGARKRGRFERADGGTLFLDEIGDISPRTQVALLRVLEERTIERVGGTQPIPVDVRIICATNRDLRGLVERGEFREDLYYRLSGITLEVPPLRERVADLPLLCEAILGRVARERGEAEKHLAPEALELLGRHRWPGNVRELENALRAASLFCDGQVIQLNDVAEHVEPLRNLAAEPAPASARVDTSARPATLPPPSAAVPSEGIQPLPQMEVAGAAYREIREAGLSLGDLKRQIERDCITRALTETGGNITRAAAVLGMKRPRLSQLVKQYGLLSNGEEESS